MSKQINLQCRLFLFVLLCAAVPAFAAESITPEELAKVKAAELARINVIGKVYGSVVAVYGQNRQGGGSGVVYDPAGYAFTNHHVVAAAGKSGKAGLADGKLYDWDLVGTDPGGDVAIIKLKGLPKFPASALGISDHVRVGDWAMAMGNPFVLADDQKPTVTLGIVSGVKRYQYGAGSNTLVYGNCIQIDSSINPGNSGGPLYNMRGQVIGINGRGSFKERGRVNVGVGYAISMKQIRNFIPDLLATKVAQHGTLDALFSNRTDGVICDTINLDSPAAQAGLDLGDKLIAFEGKSITNANQFTNLISTLPADWPAELTFGRNGKQQTIWVRTTPLPYGGQNEPEPEDEPGDDEERPRRPRRGGLQLGEEGAIGDLSANRKNTAYILSTWNKHNTTADAAEKTFRMTDKIFRKDVEIGQIETALAADGRFRVDYTEYGVKYAYGFDGEKYWSALPDEEPSEVALKDVLLQPLASHAVMLGAMLQEKPLAALGKTTLEGGDKATRRPCYRVQLQEKGDDDDDAAIARIWLTQFNDDGASLVRLAKSGVDKNCRIPGVVYEDWKRVGGLHLPHTRRLASGLAEESSVTLTTIETNVEDKIDEAQFQRPADDQ